MLLAPSDSLWEATLLNLSFLRKHKRKQCENATLRQLIVPELDK